jgi:branched-chain amino acid transport system substrate-binding protein
MGPYRKSQMIEEDTALSRRDLLRLAAIAAGLVVVRGPAAQAAQEIVIGVIYPMSGPLAQAGIDDRPAVEIAAEVANGTLDLPLPFYQRFKGMPGLKGARVRLVFSDNQGKPEIGQVEAERLITQDKVAALVGCWASSVTATASQVAERYGIPFVNAESSSPGLTRRGFKWFFRTSLNDEHYTQVMFDFFRDFQKKRGITLHTLGLTYEDTLFGSDSAKIEKELARRYGYEVVLDVPYRARSTGLESEVQRLKAANPDVWMPTSYQTDALLFVRTARELDYNPRMIMAQGAGHISSDFVAQVGREAEGTMTRAAFAEDLIEKRPAAALLNAIYSKRTGKTLYDFPALAFTALTTLLEAINRAGSTDPAAIRRALTETDIAGDQLIMTWDRVKFDENGQNAGVKGIIRQLQGGSYRTVYPFGVAARDVIYPIPPWRDRK